MNKRLLYDLANAGLLEKDVVDQAEDGHVFRSTCPIHEGADNQTAFAIKTDSRADTWYCQSRKCHQDYGCKVEGLVVALADRYADPPVGELDGRGYPKFVPALRWLRKNTPMLKAVFAERATAKVSKAANSGPGPAVSPYVWSRQEVVESLNIPSAYFLRRGFSADTLCAHAIGTTTGQPGTLFATWTDWSIVPLFDLDRGTLADRCIGFAARRHPKKCESPEDAQQRWQVSRGLPAGQRLFNYHAAGQANLRGVTRLILVEGVGDALRCIEAGYPEAVAVLGSNLLDEQVGRLARLRLREVVVVRDKDEPGRKFVDQVKEKMGPHTAKVRIITPPDPFKDAGEMPTSAAREFLADALAA